MICFFIIIYFCVCHYFKRLVKMLKFSTSVMVSGKKLDIHIVDARGSKVLNTFQNYRKK